MSYIPVKDCKKNIRQKNPGTRSQKIYQNNCYDFYISLFHTTLSAEEGYVINSKYSELKLTVSHSILLKDQNFSSTFLVA